MHSFPSVAISASAGCGKTEEIGIRLLGMLLSDAPEFSALKTLSCMTFTRAAACEIYERLITLLLNALSDNNLDKLKSRLSSLNFQMEYLSKKELHQLLRQLLLEMKSVKISTIDGFMNSAVQSFAFELGLPGSCEIMDASEINSIRKQLIRKLFQSAGVELGDESEFLDGCRQSGGITDKSVFEQTLDLLERSERIYNDNPDIKPFPISLHMNEERKKGLQAALTYCRKGGGFPKGFDKTAKDQTNLETLLPHLAACDENSYFSNKDKATMKRFFAVWDEFAANIKLPDGYKKITEFEDEKLRKAVLLLMGQGRDVLLFQAAQKTRAILEMQSKYRELYEATQLEKGRISFSDLPLLLLSEYKNWNLDIAYRLNNHFYHFLIDEFQDTSRIQWEVIESIIENAEYNGERSLFVVGDVKQAIYAWRSGDRRLMGEVIKKYQTLYNLTEIPKNFSYRYGKNICEVLNWIFGDSGAGAGALPEATKKNWHDAYKVHAPAENLKYQSEFKAFWLQADDADDEESSEVEQYAQIIKNELERLDSFGHEFSAAVLVRNNQDGILLKNELNLAFPNRFIWEGESTIGGEKIISGIALLLIYIQHPGDTLSRELVEMCVPLRRFIPRSAEEFQLANERISNYGFKYVIEDYLRQLKNASENRLESDAERADYLDFANIGLFLAAAADFDLLNYRHDALEFRDFINQRQKSETALQDKIKIMTIHHSKGLTFDFVFVPFFSRRTLNFKKAGTSGFIPVGNGKNTIYSPGDAALTVEELARGVESAHAEKVFESICTVYVALTRAKFGMYVLLPPVNKTNRKNLEKDFTLAESANSYGMMELLIDSLFVSGHFPKLLKKLADFTYFETCVSSNTAWIPKVKVRHNLEKLAFNFEKMPFRRRRFAPSEPAGADGLKFALPQTQSGANFGDKLHHFFEKIEDFTCFSDDEIADVELKNQFERCRSNPEIMDLLSLKDNQRCLREQRFDLIDGNIWISCCMDRLNLHYSSDGALEKIQIIDYKTNSFAPEELSAKVEFYRAQLEHYGKVAAKLFKLPESAIEKYLIFTRYGILTKI